MKQNVKPTMLIGVLGSMMVQWALYSCSVTPATNRMWDNALTNASLSSELLTMSSAINQSFQASLQGTFTALDSIAQSVYSIESQIGALNTLLVNTTNPSISTINSKLSTTQTSLSSLDLELHVIHVNDFGGTWTALNSLNTTLNQHFNNTQAYVNVITAQVNELGAAQYTHFIDTATALYVVSTNVLAQLVELESLSTELIVNLSAIDQSVLYTNTVLLTASSQVDIFNALLYDFSGVFTMINTLISQTITIESKLSAAEQVIIASQVATLALLDTIESNIATIQSTILQVSETSSTIDITLATILSSMFTDNAELSLIDRDISVIEQDLLTLDSKIDYGNFTALTIESALAALDTNLNVEISALALLISKVESINSFISTTVTSKVSFLNSGLITIESDIAAAPLGSLNSNLNVLNTQLSTANSLTITIASAVSVLDRKRLTVTSKVDVADATLATIFSSSQTVDSKVDYANSQIAVINILENTVQTSVSNLATLISTIQLDALSGINAVVTASSKVNILNSDSFTLSSQLDIVNANVSTIASKVNVLNTIITTDLTLSNVLIYDMQTTWTILNAINQIMQTSLSKGQTIYNQISTYVPTVDFSGVFTTIATIMSNETSDLAAALTLASKVNLYDTSCMINLGPTFTALAATTAIAATADSYVDLYVSTIQNIINTGSAISSSLASTYTISTGGRYTLAGNITFAPTVSNIPLIYVNANNVNIDMCGQTIQQTNTTSGVTGILIANGISNVTIQNGIIIGFTNNAIQFVGNNSFICVRDITLLNNNGNQLVINSSVANQGANNIYLRNITTSGGNGNGINFNNAAGIFVTNANMIGASSGSGMYVRACDYLVAQDCLSNNNQYGISAVTSNQSNQQFGMTDFVLSQCNINSNQMDGILLSGYNANGVITNCDITNNTSGIHFAQATNQIYPSTANCVTSNACSKSLSYGIYVDGSTSNNFYALNNMFSNTVVNYKENPGQGPNSVLGNYAFNVVPANNYANGLTGINTATVQNSQLFSSGSDEPTYWINISMAP